MPYCPFFSLIVFKDTDGDKVLMKRLRCKSWQCPYCARENRRLWAKHLRKRLPRVASDWWFITLTAHEKQRTPENSLENIRTNIDRLFKRLRRIYGKVDYVRVYEVHKKGAFHAHLIVSGLSARVQRDTARNGVPFYRPTLADKGKGNLSVRTWFRKTCRSFKMGYMVDVQAVNGIREVIAYIVKYLTKDAQDFEAKNLRRVQTTQRIGALRTAGDTGWRVKARVFRSDVPQDKSLYDADRKLQIPDEYWQENLTYPRPGE
jgi:hypothetical protein